MKEFKIRIPGDKEPSLIKGESFDCVVKHLKAYRLADICKILDDGMFHCNIYRETSESSEFSKGSESFKGSESSGAGKVYVCYDADGDCEADECIFFDDKTDLEGIIGDDLKEMEAECSDWWPRNMERKKEISIFDLNDTELKNLILLLLHNIREEYGGTFLTVYEKRNGHWVRYD